jgi:hypothetical protein
LCIAHKNIRKGLLLGALILLLTGVNAMAIILHPAGEPTASDIPDPNFVGRWWHSNNRGYNGSCVAIGRNLAITTAHQGIDVDPNGIVSKVEIGGITYSIDQYWTTPDNTDLRIVRLRHANLTQYADIYTVSKPNERETGKEVMIGGYGKSRLATLYTESDPNIPYGYTWTGTPDGILRFCSNEVDIFYTQDNSDDSLQADFDSLDESGATEFEGTVAHVDSGGGWFIDKGGWKLAGLTWGVETFIPNQAQFLNPSTRLPWFTPERLFAWRVSDHENWIDGIIADQQNCPYVQTDLIEDCVIDFSDFAEFARYWQRIDCGPANNYCQGADFDRRNGVDIVDLAILAADWLNIYP